ncbi:MAG: 6,7-dimethyl-8-ribityllumazine synthase [Myxococcota bacterium]
MVVFAREATEEAGVRIDRVVWIPGSLEAPLAVKALVESDRPDGVVVLGVQARGQTKHGEVIAHQATGKLLELQLRHMIPMAVAIIGPNATLEHAKAKAKYSSQKAIRAVAHMIGLLDEFRGPNVLTSPPAE